MRVRKKSRTFARQFEMKMKKIILFIALIAFSAMGFAAVSITVSPNNVNFGTVSINGKTEVEDSVTINVTYSGLVEYCGVFFEDDNMPDDGAMFWIDGTEDPGYIYGGDEWNAAEGPALQLHYYADAAGTYTGRFRFYSYNTADDWYNEVRSEYQYLTVTLTVTDEVPVVQTTSFERINSTSELKAGDVVVFVSESAGAVGGPLNDTYLPAVTENVTVDAAAGTAEIPATAQMFTLSKYSGNWQFTTTDSGQRMHLDVSYKGAFTFSDTKPNEILAGWGIEISNGVAVVSRPDDEQTFPVLFNSDRFKPYKNAIDYASPEVALYRRVQNATGLEQTVTEEGVRKEVRDGRLVIIRNGLIYTAEGQHL